MKKQIIQKIAALAVPGVLFLALGSTAFALDVSTGVKLGENEGGTAGMDTSVRATLTTKLSAKETDIVNRTTAEIKKRVGDLTELSTRIKGMKHVSDETKAALSASIDGNITNLGAVQTKIEGDTTSSEMSADAKTITEHYRVYALVVPQGKILAAADRAGTVSDMVTAVGVKIQARIDAAKAAGKDVSAIVTLQADMTAQLADAKVQALAATAAVSGLTPDNGDATILKTNNSALKSARTALVAAEKDLKAAAADMKKIIAALKGFNANVSAETKGSADSTNAGGTTAGGTQQ